MTRTLEQDIFPFLKETALTALMIPHEREWTVQGFGMMRTYLGDDKTWRLNIYHPDLAVPDVSVHHNHPWDFDSWILGGELTNIRFFKHNNRPTYFANDMLHMHGARIMTGITSPVLAAGQGGVKPEYEAWLDQVQNDTMRRGEHYKMDADEIHETRYTPGAVTLNRRIVREGTGEHADVYWPYDTDWVSAKPRLATQDEVHTYAREALRSVEAPL